MTFLEDRDLEDAVGIPEYYRGKTVFITGGSGFMGKVLVEKLLYSCTELDRIYLLLRSKKGVAPRERLAAVYSSQCFDRLRAERAGVFESKVFFIEGDCSELGLGISEEDRALIVNRTHIVFHAAASVRFDDPLRVSANLNLRGIKEMLDLAKEMRHLESFVHVSTSFCNCNHDRVEEIIYPPLADWRDLLEICENIDDHTLRVLTPKYIGAMPNTYVFTKQLAEHVINEHKGKLPIVIIRPSIVISSVSEPVPGWIDNFNGPSGLIVGGAVGILRVGYAEPDAHVDYIPVDLSVKGFIAASWIRGIKPLDSTDDIPVYNSCAGPLKLLTMMQINKYGHKQMSSVPFTNTLWAAGSTAFTTSKFIYYIKVLLLHMLPAILIDTLLWILGKKTMLVKIQRKIYTANTTLGYFTTKQWTFSNNNLVTLRSKIKEEDQKHFYYDIENIDYEHEYTINNIMGGKRYLLKEKDEDLPKARVQYKRLVLLDKAVKYLFYGAIFWWVMHTDFVRNLIDKAL